ncbi:MAG: ASPIC/UnbV domain-containing protein [Verrucomicrobia bacterium]|nr:ASPIC/UnbV domain-containing protein [Verrucomicrobiota bacterium]
MRPAAGTELRSGSRGQHPTARHRRPDHCIEATWAGRASPATRSAPARSSGTRSPFGLGDAAVAEVVRVEWPSGNVQELSDQAVDRITEDHRPDRIQPPRPSASLGGAVTLNGLGTGTYQWQFNGVDLAGETKRTLTLTNLQAVQQGAIVSS